MLQMIGPKICPMALDSFELLDFFFILNTFECKVRLSFKVQISFIQLIYIYIYKMNLRPMLCLCKQMSSIFD